MPKPRVPEGDLRNLEADQIPYWQQMFIDGGPVNLTCLIDYLMCIQEAVPRSSDPSAC